MVSRQAEALALREQGLLYRHIAVRLGLSSAQVSALVDRGRHTRAANQASAEAKRKRDGSRDGGPPCWHCGSRVCAPAGYHLEVKERQQREASRAVRRMSAPYLVLGNGWRLYAR